MGRSNGLKIFSLAAFLGLAVSCGGSDKDPDETDAGMTGDAGPGAGVDAGVLPDAGLDAGHDAGVDAGVDAGQDAGQIAVPDAGSGLDCSSCHLTASLSGAHAKHVQQGALATAIPCSECHVVPTVTPHGSATLAVTFATGRGDIANFGGSTPTWTQATATCGNVYCHGARSSGGAATAPVWTTVDGSQSKCNSCHGNPPTANAHVVTTAQFCSACHLDIGETNGIVSQPKLGLHVNGIVEQSQLGHPVGWTPPGHPSPDWSLCAPCHSGTNAMGPANACPACHTKNGM